MNETEVKSLFASAVAHPGVDRIDTDAVLRGGRRRRRVRTSATVGSVTAVVVLVASVAFVARPNLTVNPVEGVAPASLAVSCGPQGISVSSDAVAATSAGVVLSVTSTLPKGSYLGYRWSTGGGGGEPLPATSGTWTLLAPPGTLTLACQLPNASPGTPHTVTVTDPGNVWRSDTLADLGCGDGGSLSWGGPPGSGATPATAAQALFVDRPDVTAARAAMGYPGATTQTWIATTGDGKPYMSIVVSPEGSRFIATPDTLCTH